MDFDSFSSELLRKFQENSMLEFNLYKWKVVYVYCLRWISPRRSNSFFLEDSFNIIEVIVKLSLEDLIDISTDEDADGRYSKGSRDIVQTYCQVGSMYFIEKLTAKMK